ncbi:MAG: helix-turn-helix transcriptional regulator, partial [Nanoarchaeota archaeon]
AQEGERIKIIGLASNQNLNIQIQYTIGFSSGSFYSSGVLILAGLFIMIALIVVGLMFKVNYSNKTLLEKHESLTKKSSSGKEKIKYEILTERQKQILEIIKTGGKQTQKEIESKMHIPKSSVSRNIATLVARKYLIKEQMGQSNFISLNDDFEY